MIDTYSLKARVYPMVLFFLPFLILAIIYSYKFQDKTQYFTSIGLFGALTYFLSQIGRDIGKRKEAKLWKEWGGPPSIQLLRWKNEVIENNTKKRYHQKLFAVCPVDNLPTLDLENINPKGCDDIYKAWGTFIISKTRDTNKFNLIFKENVNYGFRRNLWGLKNYSILLIALMMIYTYAYNFFVIGSFNIITYEKETHLIVGTLALMMLGWIFVITKEWVKIPAYSYAERLLEACEEM